MPGRYNDRLVPGHQAGHATTSSAPSTAAPSTRDDRPVVVMEPAEFQAWLAGGPVPASRRWPRARSCSRSSPASPATAPTRGARGPALDGLFGRPVALASGETRDRRRDLPPRVDRDARGQGGGRLPADHADLPGAGERGAAASQLVAYIAVAARSAREPARRRPPPRRRQTTRSKRRADDERRPSRRCPTEHYLNADYGVQVVAAHDRPQAHRAPLPGQSITLMFFDRRASSRSASAWSC